MTADVTSYYPYLVTPDYPDVLSTPAAPQRVIGHGLSVGLVVSSGELGAEVLRPVTANELAAARVDLPTAYRHADANLSGVLSAGELQLQVFEGPTVICAGHWLAAAVLVVTGLYERLTGLLGAQIVAAVPHRDVIFVTGAADAPRLAATAEEEFRSAAKPLTPHLFTLGELGPTPF